MTDDKRVKVTLEQAIEKMDVLVSDGEHVVHTFLQAGPMLIGGDWDLRQVTAEVEKHGVELSGAAATAMRHGLVVVRGHDDGGPLFIATKEDPA